MMEGRKERKGMKGMQLTMKQERRIGEKRKGKRRRKRKMKRKERRYEDEKDEEKRKVVIGEEK